MMFLFQFGWCFIFNIIDEWVRFELIREWILVLWFIYLKDGWKKIIYKDVVNVINCIVYKFVSIIGKLEFGFFFIVVYIGFNDV